MIGIKFPLGGRIFGRDGTGHPLAGGQVGRNRSPVTAGTSRGGLQLNLHAQIIGLRECGKPTGYHKVLNRIAYGLEESDF